MAQAFLVDWTVPADDSLAAFFAEAPIFMVSTAPDWTIRRISGHFARALGHDADSLQGRPFSQFPEFVFESYNKAVQNGVFLLLPSRGAAEDESLLRSIR